MKQIPYGRQTISDRDVQAVTDALRSDWLTTGPAVDRFETAFSGFTGAQHAVAVSSGTAALHAAVHALGIGPGDEVIVSPMTFAATANAVLYCGATPVFADVQRGSLLLDPASVAQCITDRTRAVMAVDYAGQPCDYDELREITRARNLFLVADACHSIGATYKGMPVGQLADISTFSFHPVKHITTGEGGMATTNDADLAKRMRTFRNHGITTDHRERARQGAFFYEMVELGFNYRISDLNCALGTSQLTRLPEWLERRVDISRAYDAAFGDFKNVHPLAKLPERSHAWHLYVIRLDPSSGAPARAEVFARLRQDGVGCNVHYLPVYLHPYYRNRFNFSEGICPVAEEAYANILSLPIFPAMDEEDIRQVVTSVARAAQEGC